MTFIIMGKWHEVGGGWIFDGSDSGPVAKGGCGCLFMIILGLLVMFGML